MTQSSHIPKPAHSRISFGRILKNPWLLVISLSLGFYVGQYHKEFASHLIFPGSLYLALFQMSVIPIISTSIIVGLARMLRSGSAGQYLGPMVILFVLTVLAGSALGLAMGLWLEPGSNLGSATEAFIGEALLNESIHNAASQTSGVEALFTQMIPSNVFEAYSGGKVLGIMFASVLLGAAIGLSRSTGSEYFLNVVEGAQEAFGKILGWVVYGLPIGVFFLIAGQVSMLGMDAVLALSRFVIVFYLACLVLWAIYLLTIKLASNASIFSILSAVGGPVFVSFSAASAIASVPLAQKSMKNELHPPSEVVDFVLPLAVAMNRHSYAMLFALTTVFLAQLFGKTLDMSQIMFVLFSSALVGTAAAGRLAIAAPMIGYVLTPLGIPESVGITIFLTIGTILDPMVQASIVFGSCANTIILGKKIENKPSLQYKPASQT